LQAVDEQLETLRQLHAYLKLSARNGQIMDSAVDRLIADPDLSLA
jgi:hypothetical protein